MSDITYSARAKLATPPRLYLVEEVIRTMIRDNARSSVPGISERLLDDLSARQAKSITDELLHQGLIGLPKGNAPRTSVDATLVAQLGAKLGCRQGDDADDVIKTAIRIGTVAA